MVNLLNWPAVEAAFSTTDGFNHLFFSLQFWSLLVGSALALMGVALACILSRKSPKSDLGIVAMMCGAGVMPMIPGWILLHFAHGPVMAVLTFLYFFLVPLNWAVLLAVPLGLYTILEPFKKPYWTKNDGAA